MNNEIDSFTELMNLERTTTLYLRDKKWPDNDMAVEWNRFIAYLNSLSDKEFEYENISSKKIEFLQLLFDRFLKDKEHDINIILGPGKKNLPQIICCIPKLQVNNKPLGDPENEEYVLLLYNKIPKSEYTRIAIPLLKHYLNSGIKTEIIKDYIKLVFSSVGPHDAAYISDLELCFNQKYLGRKLENIKTKTFEEALSKIGVPDKYKNTLYFQMAFFFWFNTLREYSYQLVKRNYDGIKNCTEDEKKLLLARIIVVSHKAKNTEDSDLFIKKIDGEFFYKQGIDKTEAEYWKVADPAYEIIQNDELLKEAHLIYVNLFTRFIITKFYDSLGKLATDWNGKSRAEFWRRYGSSKQFVDIKLVLNSWQLKNVYAGLSQEERKIFSRHCISNNSEGRSEIPVLIIQFNSKIVADFIKTGHSGQVFNFDNTIINRIIRNGYVYNSKGLTIFTTGSVFENPHGEGRIMHSGYFWKTRTEWMLRENGITQGNDK